VTHIAADQFDALRDDVFAASFSPQATGGQGIGVEVELLAHDVDTNRPIPLRRERAGLLPAIRRIAARAGWSELVAYDGTARFDIPGRALISFEPGGQIEISTAPFENANDVVAATRSIVDALRRPLEDSGIMMRSLGIDPHNDARDIPMQLPVERYERMTEYFETIGPFGIRMMRQTAAIQISVDRGGNPARRWRLLNDLAPYLIAIFANSPIYAGRDTGHKSFRANCWRRLDVTRTGVAEESDDPAAAYTRFALDAHDMTLVDDLGEYRAFEHWLARGGSENRWPSHLTTLFPEVRPRGHFEVRSCDALPPKWYAAPIVFVVGLTYDARAAAEAAVLSAESRALLRVAGERGVHDADIARTARDLFQLALDGAARLGARFVSPALLETTKAFYTRYTAVGRSLADDALAELSPPSPTSVIRSPI